MKNYKAGLLGVTILIGLAGGSASAVAADNGTGGATATGSAASSGNAQSITAKVKRCESQLKSLQAFQGVLDNYLAAYYVVPSDLTYYATVPGNDDLRRATYSKTTGDPDRRGKINYAMVNDRFKGAYDQFVKNPELNRPIDQQNIASLKANIDATTSKIADQVGSIGDHKRNTVVPAGIDCNTVAGQQKVTALAATQKAISKLLKTAANDVHKSTQASRKDWKPLDTRTNTLARNAAAKAKRDAKKPGAAARNP